MRSWTNWFPEAEEKAMLAYVKSRLRMMARRKNPKTGLPELASVEVPCDEDGRFERVYKQLSCFDPEDYRQVCSYHSEQARHHRRLAKAYADDCRRRFGIQIAIEIEDSTVVLPFLGSGFLSGELPGQSKAVRS